MHPWATIRRLHQILNTDLHPQLQHRINSIEPTTSQTNQLTNQITHPQAYNNGPEEAHGPLSNQTIKHGIRLNAGIHAHERKLREVFHEFSGKVPHENLSKCIAVQDRSPHHRGRSNHGIQQIGFRSVQFLGRWGQRNRDGRESAVSG